MKIKEVRYKELLEYRNYVSSSSHSRVRFLKELSGLVTLIPPNIGNIN